MLALLSIVPVEYLITPNLCLMDFLILLEKKYYCFTKSNTPIKIFRNEIVINSPINLTSLINLLYRNHRKIASENKFIFYSPD